VQRYPVAVDGGEAGLEGIPFKAVIADILPGNGADFLFNSDQMSASSVIFPVVPGAGKRDRAGGLRSRSVTTWLIDSPPLSLWNSRRGKGRFAWMSLRAVKARRGALLRREQRRIQPEATAVAVRVRIYRLEVTFPQ
jgi:hypothetical protein